MKPEFLFFLLLLLSHSLSHPSFLSLFFFLNPSLQDIPRLGRIVTSTVNSISKTEKTLTTADGASHPFDFLVLAPGVSYSDPLFKSDSTSNSATLEARRRQVREAAELLERARSVVVVGGGPVGVELAAEIADEKKSKDKKITLVTSAEHLLHPKPAWIGAPAEAWLNSKGVTVVKGQKVEKVVGGEAGAQEVDEKKSKKAGAATTRATKATTLKTSPGGERIEADVVYW